MRGLSRDFVRLVSVCCAISGCNGGGFAIPGEVEPILTARPGATTATGSTGKSEFLVAGSSAVIYVPPDVRADQPVGLALFLHGASRTVNFFVDGHKKIADEARVIILAPYASVGTWDAIHGVFSSDIAVLNGALEWAFQRWTIDPAKIGMSGVLGWRYVLARHRTSEW